VARKESIKQKVLAERLGITGRHVRNLVLEGLPKDGEGPTATHPWPEARIWYDNYLRAQERKKLPEDDSADLRKRRLVAEVRKAELELAEAEGQLIPFNMHEQRIGAICDRIRRVLMTVPSKYLSRIQVTRSELEAQAVGEQIRDDTLLALQGTAGEIEDEPPEIEVADDDVEDLDDDA
jgi:hypothetical protein